MKAEFENQNNTSVRLTYADGSGKHVPVDPANTDCAALIAAGVTIGLYTGPVMPW